MKILIAIHGSHSQPEQMQAQRETWLRDLSGADYKFFLGQPEGDEPDVVYCPCPDGPLYSDAKRIHRTWILNQKTEGIVEYALENGYDYVFKCDDDTYVRPGLLLVSGFEQHDYSGFTEKHYTRETGWYRWAQGGAGYWLSRRAMEAIAEHGLRTIPAEDFAVGHALAKHGIHPHRDERYTPTMALSRSDWITTHKVWPSPMEDLHRTWHRAPQVARESTLAVHSDLAEDRIGSEPSVFAPCDVPHLPSEEQEPIRRYHKPGRPTRLSAPWDSE